MITVSNNFINRIIFTTICLMWGFAWVSAKYQIGSNISAEVGVFYRFFGIGIVSLIISLLFKQNLKATKTELKILFFYACGCASFYLVLLYHATQFIITSISAIIFSFTIIIIALLKHLLKISSERIGIIIISFVIGLFGLFFVMLQKIQANQNTDLITGITFAFIATSIYSTGSLFYEKNKAKLKLTPFPIFFYVSVFSITISFCIGVVKSLVAGKVVNYIPNISLGFVLSYLYLVFAGFGTMLMMMLIKRIGSVKASYVNLTTPVFAVCASAIFEDYKIIDSTIIGIILIVISNFIILKYGKIKKPENI